MSLMSQQCTDPRYDGTSVEQTFDAYQILPHLSDDVHTGIDIDRVHAVNDDLKCSRRHVLEQQVVADGTGCKRVKKTSQEAR